LRRLELLIEQSRQETENNEFTDSTGLPDSEFIRYANMAQERLQHLFCQARPLLFSKEKLIDVVSQQEEYSLPSDIFLNNKIILVEYTVTGQSKDNYVLKQAKLQERISFPVGHPSFYIRKSGTILLVPTPDQSNGKIRLTYVKRLNKLDIRRAKISAVTTSGSSITSLTLDNTALIDVDELNKFQYFSVVDTDGNQTMRNIKFTNIDDSTGVVTVDGSFSFESGETIAANNYIVSNKFSCNTSELPDECERYIVEYMNWKTMKRDSNSDSQELSQELQMIEQELVDSFSEPHDDVDYVTILDDQYLEFEDRY
jgi:hypothetical protein